MKVAIISAVNSFLRNIPQAFRDKEHIVASYQPGRQIDVQKLAKLLNWCDVAWYEWADATARFGIDIRPDKCNIIRLHRYETYQPVIKEINWKNVDCLLINTKNIYVMKRFVNAVKEPPSRTEIIQDGIDLEIFKFVERDFNKDKYEMCIAGNIIPRKRIYDFILWFFELELHKNFTLNIIGKRVHPEYYMDCVELINQQGLEEDVKFWDYLKQDALAKFYGQVDIIVSNSRNEGNANSIREAMATGCYPVIYDFPGRREVYGIEANHFCTEKVLKQRIKEWLTVSNETKKGVGLSNTKYIKENHNMNTQTPKMINLVEEVFNGRSASSKN